MKPEERKVLEKEAIIADGRTAYQLGRIVAIDEILESLNNSLKQDPGAKAMVIAMQLIWYPEMNKIREDILKRSGEI